MAASPAAAVQMAMLGLISACACYAALSPWSPRRWGAGPCPYLPRELAPTASPRQRDWDVTGVLSELKISPSEARL